MSDRNDNSDALELEELLGDMDSMDLDSLDLDSMGLASDELDDSFWEDFDKSMAIDENKSLLNEELEEKNALAQMTASMGDYNSDFDELKDVDDINQDEDIMDLLDRISEEDENIADINDLLKSDENDVAVTADEQEEATEELDQSEVDALLSEINGMGGYPQEEISSEEKKESPEKEEQKKEKKKDTKKPKEKKMSLWQRFLMWFNGGSLEENEIDPEDNEKILEQLEKEEKEKKAKQKEKKAKEKEEKKAEKEKEKKAEKEKKEKEKKTKQEQKLKKKAEKNKGKENVVKSKPLPKGPLLLTILFCVSILILIQLLTTFSGYSASIRQAQKYANEEDYISAYVCLEGMEIHDNDALFYQKVKLIAWIQQDLESYHTFKSYRMKEKALDALIRGWNCYDAHQKDAKNAGCEMEYQQAYSEITDALTQKFKLKEEEIKKLAILEKTDSAQYSLRIKKIVE